MKLRKYQAAAYLACQQAWGAGNRVVMLRMPTGAGKTPTFAQAVLEEPRGSVVIAHRANLVAQASLTLARYGVRHRVIGPATLQRNCASLQMRRLGRSFVDPNARCAVATVGTLVGLPVGTNWLAQIGLWVVDEGHHLLKDNIWGKAVALMPTAKGLAVTATPGRPDGKGLGKKADGLVDILVHGPEMSELFEQGYLTPYRIFAPPSDVDISHVHVGASGEFVAKELSEAFKNSKKIVGDVVKHYLRIAPGKLGMTFAVDIEEAVKIAQAFKASGVNAEVLTGETDPLVRDQIMRRFESREIMQLVSVDILGEGTDVPAVEVVSMARHTNSFIVYAQQFGRMLRLLLPAEVQAAWDDYTVEQRRDYIAASEKPFGILIDHVGNVFRHGLPDAPRPWSLDRREKRSTSKNDAIPLRECTNPEVDCFFTYERVLKACPMCGYEPQPAARTDPQFVDGDLFELDPSVLAKLRGDIARVDAPPPRLNSLSPIAQAGAAKQHRARQQAQVKLRHAMALWAGYWKHKGKTDDEIYRRFFYAFGRIDTLTAQSLNEADALALLEKIVTSLNELNVVDASQP